MVSGTIDLNAAMPRIDIVGDLKADAGWFSLEILQGVPSLDDDVKVRRAGDDPGAVSTPLQTSMNLKFDMGPRFYITGMGLDAGLLGSIQILLNDGRLTGVGALRTRGGGIEAYGQKLRLRRGTLTFQGRLDNPLLDIEALRTGEQVEAGVKVVGTAQRPRIDLVSYPDVSDVEKLSWLLLGRGPDESGSDAALLLSVGTALLGAASRSTSSSGWTTSACAPATWAVRAASCRTAPWPATSTATATASWRRNSWWPASRSPTASRSASSRRWPAATPSAGPATGWRAASRWI